MKVEPILSLAIAMQANKGTYALLLGSGVSRSAKILTGWEVTLDLIRKLAKMTGQHCEPNPDVWYRNAYGEDADYSNILKEVGKTPADRAAILKGYFEPTEEERRRGEKIPTVAHRHIAELASKGYVRLIVTTNFDHLVEDALRSIGMRPVVISTPDGILGAPPLSQPNVLVVKVHGDYLDARIKNTPDELSQYEEAIDGLLDRIFDEFGLIVCGWSATWDVAMKKALERCKSHRFTTYWTQKDSLSKETENLIVLRRAELIQIEEADTFFSNLSAKVFALEEINKPHPLEPKVAVAALKRYLQDPHAEIKVYDLVREETERLYERLVEKNYPISDRTPGYVPWNDSSHIKRRLERYEADSEVLIHLMITGCHWGGAEYEDLWWKCLERIANPAMDFPGQFSETWYRLRRYPALLLLYGAGVAAATRGRYTTLCKLLTLGTVTDIGESAKKLLVVVNSPGIIPQTLPLNLVREVFGGNSVHMISKRLADVLRNPFQALLAQDKDYDDAFDRFEHLLALVFADLAPQMALGWIPMGRIGLGRWKIPEQVTKEASEAGEDWLPLKAGLFGGEKERYNRALQTVQKFYNLQQKYSI